MANSYITIMNIGKQTIPIQVRPPNGDFYIHEKQARLQPGKTVTLPKDHINQGQIENLRARHEIRIISNS